MSDTNKKDMEGKEQKGGTQEQKTETKCQPDILDELKAQESMYRKLVLIKMVADIKVMAREILKLKEKGMALLKETGLSEEDCKRVIDFLNSQSSVQLSADDRDDIKAWAKKEVDGARKNLEAKAEKSESPFAPFLFKNHAMNLHTTDGQYSSHIVGDNHKHYRQFHNGTGDVIDMYPTITFCSSDNDAKLEVKI